MKNIKTKYTLLRIIFLILFVVLFLVKKIQLWLLVYGIGILLSFFYGRIYCGYVCPMNSSMHVVDKLAKKLKLQRKSIPPILKNPILAYGMLALSLIAMFVGKKIFQVQIPILPILFCLSLIVTLFFPPSVWHKTLCPYSILLNFGARFSKRGTTVDATKCTRTQKCLKACPAGAITMEGMNKTALIDKKYCLQCEVCTLVCPQNAISYAKN